MADQAIAVRPMESLKRLLNSDSVREQFQNALQENSNLFVASIIDLYGSSPELQQCEPAALIRECLKAATLRLPINRQLGFAWVVPYKTKGVMTPQFQIGYRGYIQLALRTNQYRHINAGVIYEGIEVYRDILTGTVEFEGDATSDKAQGYFAYLETLNGFKKTVYLTKAEVEKHGQRYSKAYSFESSPWKTDFDGMAQKTCLRMLLSKYGYMSIDMAQAMSEEKDEEDAQAAIDQGMAAGQLLEPGKTEAPKTDPEPQPQTETKQEPAKKAPFLQ